MTRIVAAIALTFVLAACGGEGGPPGAGKTPEPENARAKVLAMDPTAMTDFVIEQVKTGPGGPRSCDFVFEIVELGDVAAGANAGARAYAVQCGAPNQTSAARWIVYMPANSREPVIAPCAAGDASCAQNFLTATDPMPGTPPEERQD